MDKPVTIADMQAVLAAFVEARDWQRFHTPKNLSMALSGEAAELIELFQWKTETESWAIMDDPRSAEAVRDEIADIVLYTIRIADVLNIDIADAVHAKMAKNEAKYPADEFRGKVRQYVE